MKTHLHFLLLLTLPFLSYSQTQLGSDIDGEAEGDESGISVSLSSDGSRVAIGADLNDGNGTSSGHARIYEYNTDSGEWEKLGSDIDGEEKGDYSGYSVSLSSDGTIVAIGAYGNDGNGNRSGHVRIYEYNTDSGDWKQLGSDIYGEEKGNQSGRSVSLSSDGSRVAIGADLNDGNGTSSGHARIYEYDTASSDWEQLGSDIDGEEKGDYSGYSVSLSSDGTRVAIGAYLNYGINGENSGHVRIYEYDIDSSDWEQLGSDIDGEAEGDNSGFSVSLSSDGNRVAIGADYNYGINGENSGHVRIYEYNTNSSDWDQLGSDIDGEAEGDRSGSVSLSSDGTRVAIGAYSNYGINGENSGHVRIYEYDTASSDWEQLGSNIDGEAEGDKSGFSVSLSSDGTRVAIGSHFNDGINGGNSGHVRIYDFYQGL